MMNLEEHDKLNNEPPEADACVLKNQENTAESENIIECLERWIKRLELLKEIVISSVIICAVSGLAFVFYNEWQREPVIVEPFDVPEDLAKKGYTGSVLTNRLLDQLMANREASYNRLPDDQKHLFPNLELTNAELADTLNVQIPETSLSLNIIIQYIRRIRGSEIHISGDLVGNENNLETTIRINGKTKVVKGNLDSLNNQLNELSDYVVENIQPYFLALQYYGKKDYDKALDLIEKTLSNKDKNDDSLAYDLWGNILANKEEYEQAIEKYNKSITLDPDHDSPYIGLGYAYYQGFKNYKAAIAAYNNVIERNPNSYSAYNDLALVLMDKGNIEEAIANYQKSIAANPRYANAYYNLGLALVGLEKYKQAIEQFQHITDLPYNARNYFNAYNGLCYALSQEKNYQQAVNNCEKAIKIKPMNDNIYDTLGMVYFDQKDYEKALVNYQKAIELNAENGEAHQHLAETLAIQHKCEEANAHLAIALKKNDSTDTKTVKKHCP